MRRDNFFFNKKSTEVRCARELCRFGTLRAQLKHIFLISFSRMLSHKALSPFSEEVDSHSLPYGERISLLSKQSSVYFSSPILYGFLSEAAALKRNSKDYLKMVTHLASFLPKRESSFLFVHSII
jgi:hypothetical protein